MNDSSHNPPHEQTPAATPSERHRRTRSLVEAAEAIAGASARPGQSLAEVQVEHLLAWAEQTKCLIAESDFLTLPLACDETGEHEVRYRESDQRAVKRTWPGTFGMMPEFSMAGWVPGYATPLEYLQRFELQNLIFRDQVWLEGVIHTGEKSKLVGAVDGGCSLVISQPWLVAANPEEPHPSDDEIDALMRERGFAPLPNSFFGWFRESDNILICDAKPDNFIMSPGGILPIDLLIVRCSEE